MVKVFGTKCRKLLGTQYDRFMLNRVTSASLRSPVAYEVTLLQKAARDLN